MAELEEQRPTVESLLSVLIVQNQRIYDVLLVLLGKQDEEAYRNLVAAHEKLDNIGPVPFLMEEE